MTDSGRTGEPEDTAETIDTAGTVDAVGGTGGTGAIGAADTARLRAMLARADIGDLLARFARCLDERDFTGYAELFTADGALRMPGAEHRGRAGLAEFVAADLGRYHRTHHLITNHQVDVDGDAASSRCYLYAVHLRGPDDPADWWSVGGHYDHTYRREGGVWRIRTVDITPIWIGEGARPLPGPERE
ncbi:nuclear transport factor 2 family protein [Nocardiopsis mangrovi]|uniref:Nuclear transport factor 2 family protein n=1 Tax=Nocardiopsis mangrovi TaxID=1179818 RepID=A0ABV9DZU6_9ACTN